VFDARRPGLHPDGRIERAQVIAAMIGSHRHCGRPPLGTVLGESGRVLSSFVCSRPHFSQTYLTESRIKRPSSTRHTMPLTSPVSVLTLRHRSVCEWPHLRQHTKGRRWSPRATRSGILDCPLMSGEETSAILRDCSNAVVRFQRLLMTSQ
jgi:hypothetical protein